MIAKWNPTLAFAKREPKNDHFCSFWHCAWWEKCIFAPFFYDSIPRVFTVTIFHVIFHSIFCSLLFVPLPNRQKWAKNEFENEPKMAQEWLLWTTLLFPFELLICETQFWNKSLSPTKCNFMSIEVHNTSNSILSHIGMITQQPNNYVMLRSRGLERMSELSWLFL